MAVDGSSSCGAVNFNVTKKKNSELSFHRVQSDPDGLVDKWKYGFGMRPAYFFV